ncbi:MAG: ferrochelatase [Ardenticatenaceae bacterium]|nr:ferrochelatase [Ardenticatenaceae bacterium]MCB9444893.1 ferrochelatase [Ardenticatenaceae bacterium]
MTEQTNNSPHTGVLLVNLGTPEAPIGKALRPYLRQFLGDPRVIEYPRWLWQFILNSIILNVRPKRSAKLYAKIWTDEGSPLMVFSQKLANKLQAELSDEVKVVLAMRYGRPSIASGLDELRQAGINQIIILPLYPQYSATTVGTIFDDVFDVLKTWRWVPEIRTINQYYTHPLYILAIMDSIRTFWAENGRSQRLIYSFHGIPKAYAAKGDPYPKQCLETAQTVSTQLGLAEDEWEMTFQSRFGPEEWLRPYTNETLISRSKDGLKSVDTICPGFATDCLETLEEMAQENRHLFLEAGGEAYQYIPALNDSVAHVALLASLIRQHKQGWE